jgi:hypothetical protein
MIQSQDVIGVTRQMLDFQRAERRNKALEICVNVLCRFGGPKPSTLKTEEQGAVDNRIACFLFQQFLAKIDAVTIAVSIEYRVWNVEELGNGCIADRKDVLYEMLVRAMST